MQTKLRDCFLAGLCVMWIGCQFQTAEQDSSVPTPKKTTQSVELDEPEFSQSPELESKESEPAKRDLLEMASRLLKQAADSGSQEAKSAGKWVTGKLNELGQSGSVVAGDAADWASEMFESLRNQGLTSAKSTSDWLTEDIGNMNVLKYKIVEVPLDDLQALEEQLNALGALRWDCFHVSEKDGSIILFLKKHPRSVLRNIPFSDLMKLIPLMGSNSDEPQP